MVQQDIRWIQRFEYTHELAWKVSEGLCRISGVYRHPQLPVMPYAKPLKWD